MSLLGGQAAVHSYPTAIGSLEGPPGPSPASLTWPHTHLPPPSTPHWPGRPLQRPDWLPQLLIGPVGYLTGQGPALPVLSVLRSRGTGKEGLVGKVLMGFLAWLRAGGGLPGPAPCSPRGSAAPHLGGFLQPSQGWSVEAGLGAGSIPGGLGARPQGALRLKCTC